MKHLLIVPLIALLSVFHTSATSYSRMVDKVSSSVLRITGDQEEGHYACSGEAIGTNRVLTAAHCVGENMTADGVNATVLKADPYYDLALLSVVTYKPALTFRDVELTRFEPVTAIGYAFGLTHLSVLQAPVFLVNAVIEHDMPVGILTQMQYVGGMSGGPLVDANGLQVGVIQRSNMGVGFGVGVTLIKAFLLGAD